MSVISLSPNNNEGIIVYDIFISFLYCCIESFSLIYSYLTPRQEKKGVFMMTEEQRKSAMRMVGRGLSLQTVGDFFGVKKQYIHQICKQAGVKVEYIPFGNRRNSISKEYKGARRKVWNIVCYAVKKGILVMQPCEICGAFGKDIIEAHHDNYNEPLQVRWLCQEHHREWHKNNKPIALKISKN